MTHSLAIGVFPCTQVLPLYFGVAHGLFEGAGLAVTLPDVTSARNQMERWVAHREFDLIQTGFDNILSMNAGAFEDIPPHPNRVVNGGDGAFLTLVGNPEAVKPGGSFRLGVDSPVSGYAFVFYEVLEGMGLAHGDYQIVSCGGGRERAQTLRDGGADAVVSYPPHDTKLVEEGHRIVARAGDKLGMGYQGYVIAALESWLEENREAALAFQRVYPDAMEQCLAPANRDASVALQVAELGLPESLARTTLETMLADPNGFQTRAEIQTGPLQDTITLREKWGGQPLNRTPESYLWQAG